MNIDLFGHPLNPPKWMEAPLFDPPPVIGVPLDPPEAKPEKPKPTRRPKAKSAKRRHSLRDEVEAALRESKIPYVNVDEAKKELFANAQLTSFHFVVYCHTGANWLLWCGRPDQEGREDMREWAKVFGEGFRVVYGTRRPGGVVYQAEDGAALTLNDCLASEPSQKEQA